MRLLWLMAALPLFPLSGGQVMPEPGAANPRLQSARWQEGQVVRLTALPATGLTVLLEPGERISGVTADPAAIEARVSSERDGVLLTPRREGELGGVEVVTDRRTYRLALRTGTDLMAAYLVRFISGPPPVPVAPDTAPLPQTRLPQLPGAGALPVPRIWGYRLKGDRTVRPARISDDGVRTFIEFSEGAPLPAVFAIGPAGDEQVVNGYMRAGRFMIDEVWQELVFRIDSRKASAKRSREADGDRG